MDKAFSFIKKSNQILFFLAAVVIVTMLSMELVSKLFKQKYEPPKIELVDTSNPTEELKKPVYTVEYLSKLEDVHIFELSSEMIDTSKHHKDGIVEMLAPANFSYELSGRSYVSDNAINLMFVKENGEQHMLLKKDALIKRFSKAKFVASKNTYTHEQNLYLIINKDTNSNGFLDEKDSAQLFASTYDGKDLTLILENVGSYQFIDNNKIIVSQKADSPSFYAIDLLSSKLTKLNTEIRLASD